MKQSYFPKVEIKGRVRACLETAVRLGIKGKYIVNIGSSIGWLETELLKHKPKKLIGIEPDNQAILYSQRKVKQATFIKASADKMPVPSKVADLVFMFDVLEHVPKGQEETVFKEINRVLKKSGKLAISTPNYNWLTNLLDPAWFSGHRHYREERIKRMIGDAGFKINTIEIRGGVWSSLNLIWHYFMKWLFGKPFTVNHFLESKDNEQFTQKDGIHTIYIVATKA